MTLVSVRKQIWLIKSSTSSLLGKVSQNEEGKNGSDGLQVTHCRGSSDSKPKICCRKHCCLNNSSWKWQGQQLAGDGRFIQTEREMT